ncbi:MAG: hypothetical protein A3C02_00315 [Candidatus Andersenbacteria bacterium RIFCSPHIGHO2_02_FULL_45_11]|uniref:L-threonylcarbamoyladenylate synthase n=1 Tax=Candidatus Andersenbacteria bacterium RIFCSPHIGHO2_12_FULL_45_11 TaxID=1797281 RepID=A0A1G1X1Y5_9BACT|nr:MAG: hypothetical protein A2805_02225 [Candidatus Andersenbacteria bacterium RIFCSPHIGHO2_01_FULL_46_36]OGY33974.1 MAG: hypothetical protein A3D99_04115 [Candidatus Andersenbacteria bacterium RIFCSPHIGHO2_12_FULL_45_11]OGY34541.1 MAG: hypothetical protein A3C02_00315 [Candidatus Andersenbacteria bacterium RIFCSPHIGHO2_02_FULL_45_11]
MYAIVTKDIEIASRIIQEGRVAAFPTGTSYGLAANALAGHALQRVRNLKKRPQEKPLSVFMTETLWETYLDLSPQERIFLQQHAGAALTLLVQPKAALAHLAHDGRIGLRVIDHPLMQELADSTQLPLTATSANVAGENACYDTACIETSFPGKQDTTYDLSLGCILGGGTLLAKNTSTVAQLTQSGAQIIRQGALVLHTSSPA